MQIRTQLRNQALSLAVNPKEYALCCWERVCPSGYHGRHKRIRFKARSRHHGNEPGQSKGGQGK